MKHGPLHRMQLDLFHDAEIRAFQRWERAHRRDRVRIIRRVDVYQGLGGLIEVEAGQDLLDELQEALRQVRSS